MTRVLKLRPLCDSCERAEAVAWCVATRRTLCGRCPSVGARVPLANGSVVSALCARCAKAPAARLVNDKGVCALCAKEGKPLRANAVVFDKMDFSNLGPASRKHRDSHHRWVAANATASKDLDLSYFKTAVPASVARNAKARKSSSLSSQQPHNSRGRTSRSAGASSGGSSSRRDHT